MDEQHPTPSSSSSETNRPLTPAGTLDWRRLHLWQLQPVRDLLILAALVGLVYLGYVLRLVTVPLLLALLLAYLVEPIVRKAASWRGRNGKRLISRAGVVGAIIALGVLGVLVPLGIGVGFAAVQGVQLAGSVAHNVSLVVTSVNAESKEQRQEAFAQLPSVLQRAAESMASLKKDAEAYHEYEQKLSEYRLRQQFEEEESLRRRREYEALFGGGGTAPEDQAVPAEPTTSDETGDGAAMGAESRPPEEAGEPRPPVPAWRAQLYEGLQSVMNWVGNNAQTLTKQVGAEVLGTGAQALAVVLAGLAGLGWVVFTAFLTAFFFFFFSTGFGEVVDFWESLIPERKKGRSIELVQKMDKVIAGFVRGRLIICALIAVWTTVNYLWIGVPAPLILGPVVGLMFLVPYLATITLPVVILLMWVDPSSSAEWQRAWWWIIGAPLGVHVLGQLLDDYVLSPVIQGKTTNMDTPTILFASIAGGVLAGVYGLLVAIPVAACVKILLKEVFWPKFSAWAQGRDKDFLPISRE